MLKARRLLFLFALPIALLGCSDEPALHFAEQPLAERTVQDHVNVTARVSTSEPWPADQEFCVGALWEPPGPPDVLGFQDVCSDQAVAVEDAALLFNFGSDNPIPAAPPGEPWMLRVYIASEFDVRLASDPGVVLLVP